MKINNLVLFISSFVLISFMIAALCLGTAAKNSADVKKINTALQPTAADQLKQL